MRDRQVTGEKKSFFPVKLFDSNNGNEQKEKPNGQWSLKSSTRSARIHMMESRAWEIISQNSIIQPENLNDNSDKYFNFSFNSMEIILDLLWS